MKANIGKLILGLAFLVAGMGIVYLIWNILLGADVVYLPSRLQGISQIIPLLCCLPGCIVFTIWFFGRKKYAERVQKLDDNAFKFGGMLALAIGLDLAVGVIGLFLTGFDYISAGVVAYGLAAILQIIACLLAFIFCPPYSRH